MHDADVTIVTYAKLRWHVKWRFIQGHLVVDCRTACSQQMHEYVNT